VRIFTTLGASLLAVSILGGCADQPQPNASVATLSAVSYRDPGPSTLTLYTMVNNRSGQGGHTSLMINASERVIFDPAGSFYADVVPERDDVLYGITPGVEKAYRSSHARSTFHVVIQTIEVTPEQAETAYQLATTNGPVSGVFCAKSTAALLAGVPGFEQIDQTFYPVKLSNSFGALPGVATKTYYEDDSEDLQDGLARNNAALNG
jgi:hypothetical protein